MIAAAVFFITLSGLVFEICLTRIYSATIWYHFASVAVSVALPGWGLGGEASVLLAAVAPMGAAALLSRRLRMVAGAGVARVGMAVALIAPLGLAMGVPFPRGLRQTGRGPLPAPPFYRGINGGSTA